MKLLILGNLSENMHSNSEVALIEGLQKRQQVHVITSKENRTTKVLREKGVAFDFIPVKSKFDKAAKRKLRAFFQTQSFDIIQSLNTHYTAAAAAVKPKGSILIGYRGAFRHYWHDPVNYFANYHPSVDAVWCISDAVRKHVVKHDLLGKKDVFRVYKGMSESWFTNSKTEEIPLENKSDNIITISCIVNENRSIKGVRYLLQAINLLPVESPFRLFLIGNGHSQTTVEELITNESLRSKVEILGYRKDVLKLLSTTDIYVQPSIIEGLGRAVMEAMLSKCAIIVTKSGGPEELIKDGESGFTVPIKDHTAIANAIQKLMQDQELMKSFQQEANKRIRNDFKVQDMVENMITQYERLLKK